MNTRRDDRIGIGRAVAMALIAGSTIGLAASPAAAGPQGEKVARGAVRFERQGALTTITASRNAIINYRSFDIAPGETVRFIQPDAASRVLNRIQGPAPTRIDGSLTANGRVYIVNPAGVVFGAGSIVNAAGVIAAAGNLSDRDFLRGVDHFTGVKGEIINQGVIDAGSVALVGAAIENTGQIIADGGVVSMMVGSDVMVREADGNIMAKIDGRTVDPTRPPAPKARKGGVSSLAAGDAVAMAFVNRGEVRAKGGKVAIASSGEAVNTGTISASVENGTAGDVVMTAPVVTNAGVVSADAGSGSAGSVTITSSALTTLASGSVTSAAGGEGLASGGRLLVHSYAGDTSMERGAIVDISGGALGGDGGAGEVSGAGRLSVLGTLVGDAQPGYKAASILFDPTNINIFHGAGDDAEVGDGQVNGPDGGAVTWNISPAAIENFAGDVFLEATNDIVIFNTIFKTNGGLTLRAGRDIRFGGPGPATPDPVLFVGATELDFRAGRDIRDMVFLGTNLQSLSGDIRLTATTGQVKFGLADLPAGRTLYLTQGRSKFFRSGPFGSISNASQVNVVLDITNGYLVLGGDFGGANGYAQVGSLQAHASQSIRVEDNIDIGSDISLRSEGPVTIAGFLHAGGEISVHSGLDGSGDLTFAQHLEPGTGSLSGVDLWGRTIALRAGNGTGLATARIDVHTNGPTIHGVGGGTTRPDAMTFEQDAAIGASDLPDAAQFADAIQGMTYRVESYDAGVNITDATQVNGTALTLASETRSTVADALTLVSLDVFGVGQLRADIAADQYQRYHGAVELVNDRTLTAPQVIFETTADSLVADCNGNLGGGECPSYLTVNGGLTADGAVGAVNGLVGLTVNGASAINGGLVRTRGDQFYNGAVTLGDDTRLLSFDPAFDGVIRFDSTIDGSHNLDIMTTPGGLIVFNGDVGSLAALEDITLSTGFGVSERDIADAATIVGERSINISARNFRMGQHEKFTTLGSLRLTATQDAELGDMTTVGDMIVTTDRIVLRLRAADDLLDFTGASVTDRGLDFVAGGLIEFNTTNLELAGTAGAPAPTFADAFEGSHGVLDQFEVTRSLPEETSQAALMLNGRVLDQRTHPAAPPPPPPPP
ncbi:MAG: filamentous hemagglutinin N-terminal domain-containing protein, partial [Phycisphaerales bacterium]